MATVLTREEYMMKKVDIENRMHQTRVDEAAAKKDVNLHYEDLMQDELARYRQRRQQLMDERELKRTEVANQYKQRRREIWAEDCELVAQWRSQLGESFFTPPTSSQP